MRTVYGIYMKRGRRPLYIGSTYYTLESRFVRHVAAGRSIHFRQSPRNGDRVKEYGLMMYRHSVGEVKLVIRPIATGLRYSSALSLERALCLELQPPLNTRYLSPHKGMPTISCGPIDRLQRA